MGAGLDCSLDWTPALYVTNSAAAAAVRGFWQLKSESDSFIAYCYETIIFQYAIVTDRVGVQPIGCRLGPRPAGPGMQLTAMPCPNLPFAVPLLFNVAPSVSCRFSN